MVRNESGSGENLFQIVARLTGGSFRMDAEGLEEALGGMLEPLGSALGASEGKLYRLVSAESGFQCRESWSEAGNPASGGRFPDRFSIGDLPGFFAVLSRNEPILLDPDSPDPELGADGASFLKSLDSQLLVVTFVSGTLPEGFAGFRLPRGVPVSSADFSALRLLGDIIGGTLERRKLEIFQAESQERLNGILLSLEDGVWALDAQTDQLLFFNPACERILGETAVDLLSNPGLWFDLAHPEDRPKVAGWRKTVEESGDAEFQFRILRKDSQVRWLNVRLWYAYSVSGAPTRIDAIVSDITPQKEAARAIQEAREKEVVIAGKIQQALLIGQPPKGVVGAEIASLTIPSCGIDGDFCDFLFHDPRCFDVIIGDVMGKGLPAALVGAGTKSAFLRSLAQLSRSDRGGQLPAPSDLANQVHAQLTAQLLSLNLFITLTFARFDLVNRSLHFVDCGHTKTLLFRPKSGIVEYLEGENVPLGFFEGETYSQSTVPLEEGDILVFYSDGLTEAANPEGVMFGLENIEKTVRANHLHPADRIVGRLRQAVTDFSRAGRFDDDLTCIVVKIGSGTSGGGASSCSEADFPSHPDNLAKIRDFVLEQLGSGAGPGFSEEETNELVLAVDEAAANIILHAFKGRPEGLVRVQVWSFHDRAEVWLLYEGEPFVPPPIGEIVLDGKREGGFGLSIINQAVTSVVYDTLGERTQRVALTKIPGSGKVEEG